MKPFDKVNIADAPKTPEREIFREFANEKISQEVYSKTQSVLTAESSYKLQPLKYPTCPQSMLDYCDLRIKNNLDAHYDQTMSKALSEWIMRVKHVYDENKKDSDVFLWAMENILKIKGHPGLEKLTTSIERYNRNENEFDPNIYSTCLSVLRIDGEYRVRRDFGRVRAG
jgi:hypothetical protein